MIEVHPLANKVLMMFDSYLPPEHIPPALMATFQIPYVTDGPMRALKDKFLRILNNIPVNVYDRYPKFPSFNMSIKIMVWNVQGAGNKLSLIREVLRINDPMVLALVETHLSGDQAQRVCNRIGFSGHNRIEAQGFSGGIWLFWKEEVVTVTPYARHSQHLTVEIKKLGDDH